jgi:hypothetical protein
MKKKLEPKVTYVYQKPKTKEEAMLAESNLQRAYNILFEETEKRLREKKD